MIKTFTPKISVTLKKVQRRSGADRIAYLAASKIDDIDLTPYLGEMGEVVTARGINQPSGTFSITLANKMDPKSQDSLYASIEPMDIVVIKMARTQKGSLPIVMRGLVSSVTIGEQAGQDGRVMRTITITGHDFGKFLQIMQISYQKEYLYRNYAITAFPMAEVYGQWFGSVNASQFVERVMNSFISGDGSTPSFLETLYLNSGLKDWLEFKVEASVVGSRVGPFGIPQYEGDIWKLLSNWCDLDWNELIIEDRPDAAYLVYRPVPYYSLKNELIMAEYGATAPDEVPVSMVDVENMVLSRSDSRVANFFQVDAPVSDIFSTGVTDMLRAQAAQDGRAIVADNRNCSPEIYGLKKTVGQTNQAADDRVDMRVDADTSLKNQQASALDLWYNKRLEKLKELNADNVVYEDGHMSLIGNEAIKPGVYIRLNRSAKIAKQGEGSRYYVTHVTHQFRPFHSFTTAVQVARGEGYIDRVNQAGSPYLAESRKGVYG